MMASLLPTHALGEALENVMKEGDEWKFVFRKTNGLVNVVKFDADHDSKNRVKLNA